MAEETKRTESARYSFTAIKNSIYIPTSSSFTLISKPHVGESENDNFCVQYDPDDKYFAVGTGDGLVKVYNTMSGKLITQMINASSHSHMPITCLKYTKFN